MFESEGDTGIEAEFDLLEWSTLASEKLVLAAGTDVFAAELEGCFTLVTTNEKPGPLFFLIIILFVSSAATTGWTGTGVGDSKRGGR